MSMICHSGANECEGCMACNQDTQIAYKCTWCGENIYEGSDYYEVAGEPYCEDCVQLKTAELED